VLPNAEGPHGLLVCSTAAASNDLGQDAKCTGASTPAVCSLHGNGYKEPALLGVPYPASRIAAGCSTVVAITVHSFSHPRLQPLEGRGPG
jgi:hypothetical protein